MGFSLNPVDHLKSAAKKAVDVGNTLKNTAEDAVTVAKDAPGVIKEAAEDTYQVGKYLVDNPPNLSQVKRTTLAIGNALITGERTKIHGEMPPYPKLDPTARAEADMKGKGKSVEQRYISSDAEGKKLHEPVNLVVRGSKEDLEKALESQGWMKAPDRTVKNYIKMGGKVLLGTDENTNGPVSLMHVNGKEEVMAFNKNDNYNAGRDHLRVFHGGKDPKTGEDIWEIAGTRDTAATITIHKPEISLKDGISMEAPSFGHEIDKHIDGERDLIMDDLLKSGLVKDWAAVDGKRTGQSEARREDGSIAIGGDRYITDGKVYDVTLG